MGEEAAVGEHFGLGLTLPVAGWSCWGWCSHSNDFHPCAEITRHTQWNRMCDAIWTRRAPFKRSIKGSLILRQEKRLDIPMGGGVLFSLLKHLCIRWKSYTKELNRKYCSKEWISKGIPAFSIILKPFIDHLLCPRQRDMLHGLYCWILTKILGDSHEVSCRRTMKLGDVVCKRPCDLLKATQAAVAEITNYSKDCAFNWACAILMPEP